MKNKDVDIQELWTHPLLNVKEAGILLGISRGSVYKLIRNNLLRAGRIPTTRALFVQRNDLIALIDSSFLKSPEEEAVEEAAAFLKRKALGKRRSKIFLSEVKKIMPELFDSSGELIDPRDITNEEEK